MAPLVTALSLAQAFNLLSSHKLLGGKLSKATDLRTWLSELQREAPNIAASVVGCKLDLEAQRKVTRAEAEAFARGNSLGFFECSAKAGTNVDECIGELGARLVALGLHRQSALGGLGGLAAAKAHPAVRPVASDPCAGVGCSVQ